MLEWNKPCGLQKPRWDWLLDLKPYNYSRHTAKLYWFWECRAWSWSSQKCLRRAFRCDEHRLERKQNRLLLFWWVENQLRRQPLASDDGACYFFLAQHRRIEKVRVWARLGLVLSVSIIHFRCLPGDKNREALGSILNKSFRWAGRALRSFSNEFFASSLLHIEWQTQFPHD